MQRRGNTPRKKDTKLLPKPEATASNKRSFYRYDFTLRESQIGLGDVKLSLNSNSIMVNSVAKAEPILQDFIKKYGIIKVQDVLGNMTTGGLSGYARYRHEALCYAVQRLLTRDMEYHKSDIEVRDPFGTIIENFTPDLVISSLSKTIKANDEVLLDKLYIEVKGHETSLEISEPIVKSVLDKASLGLKTSIRSKYMVIVFSSSNVRIYTDCTVNTTNSIIRLIMDHNKLFTQIFQYFVKIRSAANQIDFDHSEKDGVTMLEGIKKCTNAVFENSTNPFILKESDCRKIYPDTIEGVASAKAYVTEIYNKDTEAYWGRIQGITKLTKPEVDAIYKDILKDYKANQDLFLNSISKENTDVPYLDSHKPIAGTPIWCYNDKIECDYKIDLLLEFDTYENSINTSGNIAEASALVNLWRKCIGVADSLDYTNDNFIDPSNLAEYNPDGSYMKHVKGEPIVKSKLKLLNKVVINESDVTDLAEQALKSKRIKQVMKKIPIYAKVTEFGDKYEKKMVKKLIKYDIIELPDVDRAREIASKRFLKSIPKNLDCHGKNFIQAFMLDMGNMGMDAKIPDTMRFQLNAILDMLRESCRTTNGGLPDYLKVDMLFEDLLGDRFVNSLLIEHIIQLEVQNNAIVINEQDNMTIFKIKSLGIYVLMSSSGPSKFVNYSLMIPKKYYKLIDKDVFGKRLEGKDFWITHFKTTDGLRSRVAISIFGAYIGAVVTLLPNYISPSLMRINSAKPNMADYLRQLFNRKNVTEMTSLEIEYVKMLKMEYMLLYANCSATNLLFKGGRYMYTQLMQPYYTVTKAHELFKDKIPKNNRNSLQVYIYGNMLATLQHGLLSDIQMGTRDEVPSFKGPNNYRGSDCIDGLLNYVTLGPCFSQNLIAIINNFESTNDKHFKGNPKYSTLAAYNKALEYYKQFNTIIPAVRLQGIVGDLERPTSTGLINRKYSEAVGVLGAISITGISSETGREAFMRKFCSSSSQVQLYALTSTSASLSYEKFEKEVMGKTFGKGSIYPSTSSKVYMEIYKAKYLTGNVFRDVETIFNHIIQIRADPAMIGKIFFKDEHGNREVVVEDLDSMLMIKLLEMLCMEITKNCPEDAITNKEASKKVIPSHYAKIKDKTKASKFGYILACTILLTADLSKYGPGSNIRSLFYQLKAVIPEVTYGFFMFIMNLVINKKITLCQDIIDEFNKDPYHSNFPGLMDLYSKIYSDGKVQIPYFEMGLGFVQGILQMTANLQHANLLRTITPIMEKWIKEKVTDYLKKMILKEDAVAGVDFEIINITTNVMGADDSASLGTVLVGLPTASSKYKIFRSSFIDVSQNERDIIMFETREHINKIIYAAFKGMDKSYSYVGWKRSEEKSSFSDKRFVEFYSRFFIGESEISQAMKFILPSLYKSHESTFSDTYDAFATGVGALVEQGSNMLVNLLIQYSQGIIHYSTIGLLTNQNMDLLGDIRRVRQPALGYFPFACSIINIGHRYFDHRNLNSMWYCRMSNATKAMYGSKVTKEGIKVHVRVAPLVTKKQDTIKENMGLKRDCEDLKNLAEGDIFNILSNNMDKALTNKLIAHKVDGINFVDTIASRNSLANYRLLFIGSGFAAVRAQSSKERMLEVLHYLTSMNYNTLNTERVITILKKIEVDAEPELGSQIGKQMSNFDANITSKVNSYYALNKTSLHHMIKCVFEIDKFLTTVRGRMGTWIDKTVSFLDKFKPILSFTNDDYRLDKWESKTFSILLNHKRDCALIGGKRDTIKEIDDFLKYTSTFGEIFEDFYEVYLDVVRDYQISNNTMINPLRGLAQPISSLLLYKDNNTIIEPFESLLVYNEIDNIIDRDDYNIGTTDITDRQTASIAIATGVSKDIDLVTVLTQLWFPEMTSNMKELGIYKEPLYSTSQLMQNLKGYQTSMPFLEATLQDTRQNCQEEEIIALIDLIKSRTREVRNFRSNPKFKPMRKKKMGLTNLMVQQVKYNFYPGFKFTNADKVKDTYIDLSKYKGYAEVMRIADAYLIISRLDECGLLDQRTLSLLLDFMSRGTFDVGYSDLMVIARGLINNPLMKKVSKPVANLINLIYIHSGGNPEDMGEVILNDLKAVLFLDKRDKKAVVENGKVIIKYLGEGRCLVRRENIYLELHLKDDNLILVKMEELSEREVFRVYKIIQQTLIKIKVNMLYASQGDIIETTMGLVKVDRVFNSNGYISTSTFGLPISFTIKDTIKNLFINSVKKLYMIKGEAVYDHINRTLRIENDDMANYHALSVCKLGQCDLTAGFMDKDWCKKLLPAGQIVIMGRMVSNISLVSNGKDFTSDLFKIRDGNREAFGNLAIRSIRVISNFGYLENNLLMEIIAKVQCFETLLNEIIAEIRYNNLNTKSTAFVDMRGFLRNQNLDQQARSVASCCSWAYYTNLGRINNDLLDLFRKAKQSETKGDVVLLLKEEGIEEAEQEKKEEQDPFDFEITAVDKTWNDEDDMPNLNVPQITNIKGFVLSDMVITPVVIREPKNSKTNTVTFQNAGAYWNLKYLDYLRKHLSTRVYFDLCLHLMGELKTNNGVPNLERPLITLLGLFPNLDFGKVVSTTQHLLKKLADIIRSIATMVEFIVVTVLIEESSDESLRDDYMATGYTTDEEEDMFGDN